MLENRNALYSIIFLRFVIATVILIVNTTLFGIAHTQIFFIISAVYVLTIIYSLLGLANINNIFFLSLQMLLDLVIEAILVHYTGGVDSVLGILFPLSTIAAGIVISPRAAVVTAFLGSAMYSALLSLEFLNILPPQGFFNILPRESSYVFSLLYFRVTVFCIIGFLVAYITEQVKKKDRVVMSLKEKLRQEDRLSEIGKLAARTAHEIRNPLASLSGCVESLKESVALNESNERLFNLVIKETSRLNDIINGLLEYVKPRKLQLEKISADEILDEVIFLVKNNKNFNKNITIKKENLEPGLKISCDPKQLKQVFFNLLINAVEAVGENGKIIIREKFEKERNMLAIEVTDNGKGIEQKLLDNLFEPFSSGKDSGVGLGLAIASSIIKEHQGNILIETKKGRGSTFRVLLPTVIKFDRET